MSFEAFIHRGLVFGRQEQENDIKSDKQQL